MENVFEEVDPGQAIGELMSGGFTDDKLPAPEAKTASGTDANVPAKSEPTPATNSNESATAEETKSQTTPEAGAGTTTLTQQTDGSVVDDKGNKVETAAQALSIDPHQLVKLPDGSTAPWHKVIGGTLLKAKYDE